MSSRSIVDVRGPGQAGPLHSSAIHCASPAGSGVHAHALMLLAPPAGVAGELFLNDCVAGIETNPSTAMSGRDIALRRAGSACLAKHRIGAS